MIKWKRIEAGHYEATDGPEVIAKRFDDDLPWVLAEDDRYGTLKEAKSAAEAFRTAAAAPEVPTEQWGVATMDGGLLTWYSSKVEALGWVADLGGNLTISLSTEDFVEVHSGYPGEETVSTYWLGTAEGLKREGVEVSPE